MLAGFRSLVPELRQARGLEFDVMPMPDRRRPGHGRRDQRPVHLAATPPTSASPPTCWSTSSRPSRCARGARRLPGAGQRHGRAVRRLPPAGPAAGARRRLQHQRPLHAAAAAGRRLRRPRGGGRRPAARQLLDVAGARPRAAHRADRRGLADRCCRPRTPSRRARRRARRARRARSARLRSASGSGSASGGPRRGSRR